jgi:hypothetical protein
MSRWLERLQTLEAEPEEDEGRVAHIAEHADPGVPTKPNTSPVTQMSQSGKSSQNGRNSNGAVSSVSEADAPSQYWSDVLQERFWVVPTAAQASALAAQGQVAYQPDEIWQLRDLKASDPQPFSEKLRALHQAKSLFDATVMHEALPATGRTARREARERPAKPRDPRLGPILPPCVCGELRYWHDHDADSWHCWTCTPPPQRPSPAAALPEEGVL